MRSLADIPRHLTNFVHLAASHRYVVSWCRSGLGNRRVFSSPLSFSLCLCLYAMSSDSNLTSMGRGLEYDLWSGQFALDGARPSEFQAVLGQVQILQQQMTAIADTQFGSDDRYCRSRQENAALTARLQMLEESLRDVEMRAQQQLGDEQRRNKEIMVRVEREKQLEIENCHIKLQAIEREMEMLREESARLRSQTERLRTDRTALQQRLDDTETSLHEAQEELRCMNDMVKREREQWALEHASSKQLASELTNEVDALRKQINSTSESLERRSSGGGAGGGGAGVDGLSSTDASSPPSRVEELENEIKNLKQQNNSLKESNEELHAQLFSRGLEEGRSLLNEHNDNSLAAEFEVMSQEDIRTALREQQDVNASLRSYIEGILLTIVENQPSLLEVKPPCPL